MLTLALAGLWIGACFVGMALLRDLQARLIPFLILYGLAFVGYLAAVWGALRLEKTDRAPVAARDPLRGPQRQGRRCRTLALIVGLAILYRLALLFAGPPTLSSDVYRYIWDGRLSNAGVSPYAHAVHSPQLDAYDVALPQRGDLRGAQSVRAQVNNDWMASPYLPAAQAFFWLVYRLAPDSPLAFQVAAVACDLLAGWMAVDMLRRLGLPVSRALVYFWNPLLAVEGAHGAHVDAWMVCLAVAALWALVAASDTGIAAAGKAADAKVRPAQKPGFCQKPGFSPRADRPAIWTSRNDRYRLLSVLALAAATLTKGLPALLLPVVARRWKRTHAALYLAAIAAICLPFGLRAGWGLRLPPDGTGLLGATLVYGAYWNFNSGLYHWLEVLLSGYPTPGPVPQEAVGWGPIYAAKALSGLLLGAVLWGVWRAQRAPRPLRTPSPLLPQRASDPISLLRWSLVPLAAYLLLTTTVHPWYLTWVLPFAPFLFPVGTSPSERRPRRALAPLLYWTAVVPLSYLTYLDPGRPREVGWVRLVEYVPLYALLAWAALPWLRSAAPAHAGHPAPCASDGAGPPEPGPRPPGTQSPPHRGPPRAPGPG